MATRAKIAKRAAVRKPRKETFTRFDTADYLKSEEDMVAYFEACLAEGDTRLVSVALGNIARARGMMKLAQETGLTREGLYKALSAEGNPSLDTVLKVTKALGLKLTPKAA